MKHLRKFDSVSAMTTTISSSQITIVGMALDNNVPVFGRKSVTTPPAPAHDYVEIGGVKWATMNVGAETIYDYGLYFQWGDTQGYTAEQAGEGSGQKPFGWEDYKYCDGTENNMTKYNSTDGKTVLDLSDDAVNAAWGGNWRMPTTAEFQALGQAVNAVWTRNYNDSGFNGLVCTDKTDSSKVLFFPSAGIRAKGQSVGSEFYAYYWSSSLKAAQESYAFMMYLNPPSVYWNVQGGRSSGIPVRGVLDE